MRHYLFIHSFPVRVSLFTDFFAGGFRPGRIFRIRTKTMPWIYEQQTGKFYHNETYEATGYAGRDEGKNNPDMQNVKGIGPIPRGWYTIHPPRDSDMVGPYALPLVPDPDNNMFGRASFYIHGDSIQHPGSASHGCIVQKTFVRIKIWQTLDHRLEVVRVIS
jgi:hypothetical protein